MKKLFLFAAFVFSAMIVVFPADAMESAQNALILCQNTLIPSLFPFLVCSNLLLSLGGDTAMSRLTQNVMMPLFKIRGAGSIALTLGLLSGYPCGAMTTCNLYQSGAVSRGEAHRLLSFANNSGPLFIISAVGLGVYQNTKIGVLLYISHLLAALSVGFIGRFFSSNKNEHSHSITLAKKSPSKALPESVLSILNLCGYVVFFAVLYKMLQKCGVITILERFFSFLGMPSSVCALLSGGIFEITTALKSAGCTHLPAVAAIISIGGISVLFQTMSFTKKASLSIKPYIIGKILAGGFSAFFMALLLRFFPVEISALSPLTKAKLMEYPPYFVAFATSVFCFLYYFITLSLPVPQDGKSACPEKQSFVRTRS